MSQEITQVASPTQEVTPVEVPDLHSSAAQPETTAAADLLRTTFFTEGDPNLTPELIQTLAQVAGVDVATADMNTQVEAVKQSALDHADHLYTKALETRSWGNFTRNMLSTLFYRDPVDKVFSRAKNMKEYLLEQVEERAIWRQRCKQAHEQSVAKITGAVDRFIAQHATQAAALPA